MTLPEISAALLKKGLTIARPPASDDPERVGDVKCKTCGWRADGLRLDVLARDPQAGCVGCELKRMAPWPHP